VACEACQGPGAEHSARNHSPLRRYALQLSARADPSIRNPARMSGQRSAQVCGRCHGQRISAEVGRFLRHGDPFVPGDDLSQRSEPLWRETTQNGQTGLFAPRFWNDGTARLTAYEFQGYLQSPCARDERFSCESCHAMHRGDPRGPLRPDRLGDAACTQCHAALAGADALRAHSHHAPDGPGARCASCHMPALVYGLVDVRISHRIESPDPALQARDARPDACTLCHVDRTRAWAAQVSERWYGRRTVSSVPDAVPAPRSELARLPEVTRALFGGDPIERAIAAHALGRATAQAAPEQRRRALGALARVLSDDAYPAVRRIAERSLRRRLGEARPELLPLLAVYSAGLPPTRRAALLEPLRAALVPQAAQAIGPQTRSALQAQAVQLAIEIGE